jgi:hypothetical protein
VTDDTHWDCYKKSGSRRVQKGCSFVLTGQSASQSTLAAFALDFVGLTVLWVAKALLLVYFALLALRVVVGSWREPLSGWTVLTFARGSFRRVTERPRH